jgi:hypothetical protein
VADPDPARAAPDDRDDADATDGADVVAAAVAPHAPPPWAPLTLVAFVALVVCTNIANVVWPRWSHARPGGLIALSARQRYLVLAVAGGIAPVAFFTIAALRLAVAFVVCHLVGRAYRDQALSWFTRYLGVRPEQLAALNGGFAKAEVGVVPFFAGSNIVAVLTGIHRTPPARLALLLAVGIGGRLVLMWWLAKAFEEPLLDVITFIGRYQWWLVAASVVLVVLVNVRNLRGGAGS